MAKQRQFYKQYCARNSGLPCIHGPTTPHDVCEIMGPTVGFTLTGATQIAQHGGMSRGPQRDAVVARMVAWGECLFHAAANVCRNTCCGCAACQPTPGRAWNKYIAPLIAVSPEFDYPTPAAV